jgi:hypothetical protein
MTEPVPSKELGDDPWSAAARVQAERKNVEFKEAVDRLRNCSNLDYPASPGLVKIIANVIESLQRELDREQNEHAVLQSRCFEGFPSATDGIFDAYRALRSAHEPPAVPYGWVERQTNKFIECEHQPTMRGDWIPLYHRPAQPPPVDDVDQRARARFIENHGLPAHDPWDLAPSATKHEYREWARNNTPTKSEGQG